MDVCIGEFLIRVHLVECIFIVHGGGGYGMVRCRNYNDSCSDCYLYMCPHILLSRRELRSDSQGLSSMLTRILYAEKGGGGI